MKKLKKIVSLIITMIMVVSAFSGCGTKKVNTDDDTSKYITRGAWVEAIGTIWGMDEYNEKVPYFTDVPSDSEIFPYVQSCYEWNVISTDKKEFKKDEVATLGFAVSSATMILSAADVDMTNEEILNKAVEYKILNEEDNTEEKLRQGITPEEADNIIALTQALYFSDNANQVCDIDLVENIKDYSKEDNITLVNDSTYTVSEKVADELEQSDVFIIDSENGTGGQVALKVVSKKDNGDGTYTIVTEIPDAEDVIESVDIEGTYCPDYENIIPEDGIKVTPIEDDNSAETTYFNLPEADYSNCIINSQDEYSYIQNDAIKKKTKKGFKFEVELSSDKPPKATASANKTLEDEDGNSVGVVIDSNGYPSFSHKEAVTGDPRIEADFEMADVGQEVADAFKDMNITGKDLTNTNVADMLKNFSNGLIKDDAILEKLKESSDNAIAPSKPFSSGYTIKGSIEVKNFKVTPDVKIDKILKLKRASVSVSGEIVNSLSITGKLNTEVKIATIPIVTVGIASVDLDLYLYADLNGEVSVKTTINVNSKLEVNEKKDVKKSNDCKVTTDAEVKASIEAGAAVAVAVKALGIDIISLRLKAGALVDASAKETFNTNAYMDGDELVCEEKADMDIKVYAYMPVIKIEFNKTKKCLLGKFISGEFIISDKDSIDKGKESGSGFGNLCAKQELYSDDFNIYTITYRVKKPDKTEDESGIGNYLSLDHIAQKVDAGKTVTIKVENIPEGYEEKDIEWSSEDSSIATVTNGKVKGISEGTVGIVAQTSDGKYRAVCSVNVIE